MPKYRHYNIVHVNNRTECEMDTVITIGVNDTLKLEKKAFTKMSFVYNAINDGWTVRKKKDRYIFTKSHGGRKEVFDDTYLTSFIKSNMDISGYN